MAASSKKEEFRVVLGEVDLQPGMATVEEARLLLGEV